MLAMSVVRTSHRDLPGVTFHVVVFVPAGDGERARVRTVARFMTGLAVAQLARR